MNVSPISPPAQQRPLRIAALVDLPRSAQAGGHVKWWERLAAAAAAEAGNPPFDLTVYFSGGGPDEILSPHVRLRHLPPVFSTARLTFLPYVPDHTDLAPYHPRLARELPHYDLIHTTDGFFAFARTAERIARRRAIPLTTSIHTDTPVYARIFTRQTIDRLFARWPWAKNKLIEDWDAPERRGLVMDRRLRRHLGQCACACAFVTRTRDRELATGVLGDARVRNLRLGVDKAMFDPRRRDSEGMRRDYAIPEGRLVALFVGRVDVGKNVPVLIEAAERAIAAGVELHLMIAGIGPMTDEAARRLGGHVSLLGFVEPERLARLYASVDLLALPSEVEIGSMATTEAIASGCPALVAQGSGTAAVFGDTPAIRIVEGGAESWAAALRELADNGDSLPAMRAAALDYSARHLASWRDVLREDLLGGWRAALKIV
ncbi:glycosyltransferase [Methylocapsa sp. S129]|uniref:glycosyltransferase n=1 Tax=Methylocapsa sp. S129 TaxID=1641869 RepID=UPI00131C4F97|nr:glycosyltransferase [Methylocapsa sp. S129]